MANKENLPPRLATPPISKISPANKPALGRQRDHSACRAADTPLKVKKTRENLKQAALYAAVPPPCLHPHGVQHGRPAAALEPTPSTNHTSASLLPRDATDNALAPPALAPVTTSPNSKISRQKSVSRRMLSRVKHGLTATTSAKSRAIRATDSEMSLVRRLSGRRKGSSDADSRARSFELRRESVDSGIRGPSGDVTEREGRSFTGSTVSTSISDILDGFAAVRVPNVQTSWAELSTIEASSSPPSELDAEGQPTPRPPRKSGVLDQVGRESSVVLSVPCVDLSVAVDCSTVDVSWKRDVWVVVDATVRLKTMRVWAQGGHIDADAKFSVPLDTSAVQLDHDELGSKARTGVEVGAITNLRLCYKPADGCRIRNIIGQKSYKDLTVGQRCTLFIRVGVPRLQTKDDSAEPDQDSLFTELESIVGTLETDILHVEARYRHSMLPSDNIVALKHTCKVLRPRTESRWSIVGLYEKDDGSTEVHGRLARYLADSYAADEALELLHRYFDYGTRARPGLAEICSELQGNIDLQRNVLNDTQPEVVITDIDLNADGALDAIPEQYDTAPSTPVEPVGPAGSPATSHRRVNSATSFPSPNLAPPLISAPRATAAITTSTLSSSPPSCVPSHNSQDSARQVWRHIRRTSLSARQLEDMTPERVSKLEAGDDSLKELRRKALANKRSVGAETLRAWKWEASLEGSGRVGEAPWM